MISPKDSSAFHQKAPKYRWCGGRCKVTTGCFFICLFEVVGIVYCVAVGGWLITQSSTTLTLGSDNLTLGWKNVTLGSDNLTLVSANQTIVWDNLILSLGILSTSVSSLLFLAIILLAEATIRCNPLFIIPHLIMQVLFVIMCIVVGFALFGTKIPYDGAHAIFFVVYIFIAVMEIWFIFAFVRLYRYFRDRQAFLERYGVKDGLAWNKDKI